MIRILLIGLQKLSLVIHSKFCILNYFYNFSGMLFNAPEVMPTIQQVEHTFGATHPGVFDAEKQTFTLNFRGISFCFNVDSKFQVRTSF